MAHRLLACFVTMAGLAAGQISFSPQTNPNLPSDPNNVQQPSAATKRYPVSGTVINSVTGAPVARALVTLQGMEPAQTFSGDDGHFELKDVPEGPAFLSARRPGFQIGGRGMQQQVTISSSTSPFVLKMMPQSSLHGRVTNNEGEPVENLQIQVLRQQVMNGYRDWVPGNMASSDETGSFEIDDLQPGAYLLKTLPHRVFLASASVVVDGRHFPDLYPAQYYPNAPDRASAQPIQIQPGSDAQMDLTLTAVPSYSASGTVNSRNVRLTCESPEGEMISSGVRIDRNGAFTLMQLPAGPCTLRARSGGGRNGGDATYAELPINIVSADLNGLQLNMEALPEIPLTITGNAPAAASSDSGSKTGNTGANIQLIPNQRWNGNGFPMLSQKGDSKAFTGVTPGVYRVSAQAFGGTCIGSINSGSLDLLRSDLTVAAGGSAAPIEVALRRDCGSLSIKVEGNNSADPIWVVIIPAAAPILARMSMFSGGSMQLGDLTPGDYMIYAAADLTDFAYADPEALKKMEGQKVTVGPNAQASVQIQAATTPGGNQ